MRFEDMTGTTTGPKQGEVWLFTLGQLLSMEEYTFAGQSYGWMTGVIYFIFRGKSDEMYTLTKDEFFNQQRYRRINYKYYLLIHNDDRIKLFESEELIPNTMEEKIKLASLAGFDYSGPADGGEWGDDTLELWNMSDLINLGDAKALKAQMEYLERENTRLKAAKEENHHG